MVNKGIKKNGYIFHIPVCCNENYFHLKGVTASVLRRICNTVANMNFTCSTGVVFGVVNTVFNITADTRLGLT